METIDKEVSQQENNQVLETQKPKKTKRYFFRLFFKEMKRVKWPDGSYTFKSFSKVLIFSIVLMLIFFGISIAAALLWNHTGVGVN